MTLADIEADIRRLTQELTDANGKLADARARLAAQQAALQQDYANQASGATITNTLTQIETWKAKVAEFTGLVANVQQELDAANRRRTAFLQYEQQALANGLSPEQAAQVAASKVQTAQTVQTVLRVVAYVAVGAIIIGLVYWIIKRKRKKA